MKKIYTLNLIAALAFIINGCTGPEGPVGQQGPQGPKGDQGPAGESSYVFEFDNINFTAPDYDVLLTYPSSFEGFASDVTMVYLLWGTDQVNGETVDIWRPLPQSIFKSGGQLVYNFDFTKNDVRLFLTADFSLDGLTAIDTDDWVARVVVVPGNFWTSARLDPSIGYNDLMELLKLNGISVVDSVIHNP